MSESPEAIAARHPAYMRELEKAMAEYGLIPSPPRSRRVRRRLRREKTIDRLACRLVDHGHIRAAIALWRAFGMWS